MLATISPCTNTTAFNSYVSQYSVKLPKEHFLTGHALTNKALTNYGCNYLNSQPHLHTSFVVAVLSMPSKPYRSICRISLAFADISPEQRATAPTQKNSKCQRNFKGWLTNSTVCCYFNPRQHEFDVNNLSTRMCNGTWEMQFSFCS